MKTATVSSIHDRIQKLSDEAWLETLVQSLQLSEVDGIPLPGFPEDEVQRITNSQNGETTLRLANDFYRISTELLTENAESLTRNSRILDYGCGWGRIARFFYRDVHEANVFGVDVNPKLIEVCEKTMPVSRFAVIDPMGPIPYPDNHFDMVYSNSVFSHLNDALHKHAITEIARVLRPGGIAINTIIDEYTFDRWRSDSRQTVEWALTLLGDSTDFRAKLAKGEMVWCNSGRTGLLNGYGLAIVPLSHVQLRWPGLEFRDARYDYSQTIVLSVKAT